MTRIRHQRRPWGRPRGSLDLLGRAARAVRNYRSHRWKALCREFGQQLRSARVDRAVSAAELAAAINGSVSAVLKYERGECIASMITIDAMARALGCSIVDLLPESARFP